MAVPSIDLGVLEIVCERLADTSTGLTESAIGKLLRALGLADPIPEMTKRIRLFEALKAKQAVDGCANNVIAFIQEAMKPVRHTDSPEWFEKKRDEINTVASRERNRSVLFTKLEGTSVGTPPRGCATSAHCGSPGKRNRSCRDDSLDTSILPDCSVGFLILVRRQRQ